MIPIGDDPRRHTFPFMTVLILITNVAVFAYELTLRPRALTAFFASAGTIPTEILTGRDVPPAAPISVYATLITAMFIHGSLMHIGSNMLFLWVFGDNVEDRFGHVGYTVFYLVTGIAAGLTHVWVNSSSTVPSVGASGAIAGVLGAYLILFPQAQVRTLVILGWFITIARVPALLLIGFWFVTQLFSGLAALDAPQSTGVAFWAHIGGFVAGLVLAKVFASRPPARAEEPW